MKQTMFEFSMAATVGQLFNFLVFCASLIILINNVMEFRYKVVLFKHFEDNLGLLNNILIMATSFGATFFSISSPYEDEAYADYTDGDETFTTVLYLVFLLVSSLSVPTDDPTILFRSTYEAIIVATNGTLVSENINVYELEGEQLITDIGVWYIQGVNYSKLFLFLAALVYAIRVVLDNKPDLGKETRRNFREFIIGRVLLMAVIGVATFFWVINVININNITIRAAVTNAEELLEDYSVGGINAWLVTPLVQTAFAYMVTLALLVTATYIAIFYKNFEFGLACVLTVLIQNLVRADELLIDDATFTIMVVTLCLTTIAFIGTGVNWMYEKYKAGVVFGKIVPNIMYKAGSILSIISLIFLVSAFTYNWIDFEFKPAGLALEVAQAMDNADARIDNVVDSIYSVARILDPCTRKNAPTGVTYGGDTVVAAGDAASVDEQMRQAREDIKNNVASADNVCILSAPDFLVDTGLSPRCENLDTQLRDQRDALVAAQNEADSLQSPYGPEDEDNEFFVDEHCRSVQCSVLLATGIGAMVLSAIPFCGIAGFAAGTAGRAANVIYKIGRKIIKFAPKIKRKRNKIRKLANRIRKLSVVTKGKLHFTLRLSLVFIPVILGATITLCILMFRRDIYRRDNKEGAYQRVRQIDVEGDFTLKSFKLVEKLNRGLTMVLGIYLPLSLVNTAFYITLVVMPELFNALFNELPQVLVNIQMETEIGYTSLKLAYLVAAIGNGLIVASNLLYLFDNSVIAIFLWMWTRTKNVFRRFRKLYRESSTRRSVAAEKRLLEYDGGPITTAADSRLRVTRNIRGWSRWVRIRLLNLLDVLGNWKSLYFQPLFFSLPALYFVWRGIIVDEKYFIFAYKANSDTTAANDEIVEVVAQEDRSEAVNQELDNGLCGLVGQLAESILEAIPGGLSVVSDAVADFTNVLTGAFSAASDFVAELSDLVDFPSIDLDLPEIPGLPSTLANFGIYGIPMICSMLLLGMWIAALFIDKLGAFAGMLNSLNKAVKGETGDDKDETTIVVTAEDSEYQIAASVAVFILYASLTNILMHTVIGHLVQTISGYEMPFITVDVTLGPDYWLTQACSLMNLMSAVSLYVNILLPINE